MNKIVIAVLALMILTAFQEVKSQNAEILPRQNNPESMFILTAQDSILAASVPKLELPDEYKVRGGRDLPPVVNNANTPYLRPIFTQENYANCGQSSGIAYNFTYEINRARGVPSDNESTQYTPQFTWNFMNGGNGWYGVSYFHSFEILKSVGNPSVEEYGGMFYGGGKRWMSGYEAYRNTMNNRIAEVYSIDISTIEGINTLKYWLYDHLEGDTCGGIASFYTYSAWGSSTLPSGTPEGGKHVIVYWRVPAGHALTIVGYNDSIRFDFNNDGRYTNDEDINGDGVVDLKDWEIGGFLFVNSYGEQWLDSGFCYAMYSTFGHKYGDGGIWNQTVNVLKVKPYYQPTLGLKLKLKHNSRNKLKVLAGISSDVNSNYPEHVIDFPILNYQGGNKLMKGLDTLPDPDELEVELDITPLLSFVDPDEPARYFVQVVERDDRHEGVGRILHYGVVDYATNNETVCSETPVDITDNSITTLSVVKQFQFDAPVITTEELPAVEPGTPYQVQLEAEGGTPPYSWSLMKDYQLSVAAEEFPGTEGTELTFSNNDTAFVRLDLPFPFPFYGDTVNQIYVYIDGFVTFDRTYLPYPYFRGEATMLRNNKMIAPLFSNLILDSDSRDKITYESTEDYFLVKWKTSYDLISHLEHFSFAMKIFPSGKVITWFDDTDIPAGIVWTSGMSSGDKVNYLINPIQNTTLGLSGRCFTYNPVQFNIGHVSLSPEGLLEISDFNSEQISQIRARVTDDRNISAVKEFQLSSGLLISYEISSGDDENIEYDETVSLKAKVKNNSSVTIENIQLNYSTEDEYIQILQQSTEIGTLHAGETIVIDSSCVFKVAADIPGGHSFELINNVEASDSNREFIATMWVMAPALTVVDATCNGVGWIEPGATDLVNFRIVNSGQITVENIDVKISFESSDVQVSGSDTQLLDQLNPGEETVIGYRLYVKPWVVSGTRMPAHFTFYKNGEFVGERVYSLLLGRTHVLIADLDPKHITVDSLKQDLDHLNINYEVNDYIPEDLMSYKSVFVLLGSLFNNHELSNNEGVLLKNYLNDNGNVYMEGRVTWKQEETPVHNMFNVDLPEDQYFFYIDTLFSIPNDTTERIMMGFESDRPYIDYYLMPGDSAFEMLLFSDDDSAAVVASKTEIYKSVASIVEYGCLTNLMPDSARINYLEMIVDFFGLYDSAVGIEVNADTANSRLLAYPNPFTDRVTFVAQGISGSATIQIFNRHGRMVFTKQIVPPTGNSPEVCFTWDGRSLSGKILPKGVYIASLTNGNRSYVAKIVRF
jgi:hypothetical protein